MINTEKIQALSNKYYPDVVGIRRHLHAHPELSFEEHKTAEYISDLLTRWNIVHRSGIAGTGILARIEGKSKAKVIAFRADMDALPVEEQNNVEYRSVNPGKMHACGHDVHMASLLGAIRILNDLKDQMDGTILFVFQPGEEKIPGGAKLMLEEDLFGETQPELIIAQHVFPDLPAGEAGFRSGVYMASSDEIYIKVNGKGGHAALPDALIDPVLISAHILTGLQQLVSRRAKPGLPTVLSFGKVEAPGAVNVIPDWVKLEGTFRTMDEEWRVKAHELIQKYATKTAEGMGGTAEVEIRHGYPVLINNEALTEQAVLFASEFLGPEKVHKLDIRMTAEDFAYFSLKYPACLYRIGVASPGSTCAPLHSPRFDADENALRTSIGLLSYLAMKFVQS